MADDLPDHTLLLELGQRFSRERAVDFQAVDEHGDGDEAVGLNVLVQTLVGLLVEDNGMLGLVLN